MIRRMRASDREAFLRLTEEVYRSPAVAHDIPAARHAEMFEEIRRAEEYALGYMLEEDGKAVGYGLVSVTYSHEAGGKVLWLEELYIAEEYRGRGLGSEFFAAAEGYAQAHGFARLRLEVEPANVRAIALYERLGYAPLCYRQMIKELRPPRE